MSWSRGGKQRFLKTRNRCLILHLVGLEEKWEYKVINLLLQILESLPRHINFKFHRAQIISVGISENFPFWRQLHYSLVCKLLEIPFWCLSLFPHWILQALKFFREQHQSHISYSPLSLFSGHVKRRHNTRTQLWLKMLPN